MKSQKVTFQKSQKLLAENLQASSFCDFWKNDLLEFNLILFFFFIQANVFFLLFFYVLGLGVLWLIYANLWFI